MLKTIDVRDIFIITVCLAHNILNSLKVRTTLFTSICVQHQEGVQKSLLNKRMNEYAILRYECPYNNTCVEHNVKSHELVYFLISTPLG